MAKEFEATIMRSFVHNIARKLGEESMFTRAADDLGKQGLIERAFRSMLDIEPLIHEGSILLTASSGVRR